MQYFIQLEFSESILIDIIFPWRQESCFRDLNNRRKILGGDNSLVNFRNHNFLRKTIEFNIILRFGSLQSIEVLLFVVVVEVLIHVVVVVVRWVSM